MKLIYSALFLLLLLPGCNKESRPPDIPGSTIDLSKPVDSATLRKYHYDTITFKPVDLTPLNLKAAAVYCDASVPAGIWSLKIELYDSINSSDKISFSVQDLHNSKDSLVKTGMHPATGEGGDAIINNLQSKGFTINSLTPDQFGICLEELVPESDNNLSVKGYIEIRKEIYWKWPAGIWNGTNYIYPGDQDYLACCFPVYYKPVKIYFNTIEKK